MINNMFFMSNDDDRQIHFDRFKYYIAVSLYHQMYNRRRFLSSLRRSNNNDKRYNQMINTRETTCRISDRKNTIDNATFTQWEEETENQIDLKVHKKNS